MKKLLIGAALAALIGAGLSAQMTIESAGAATFEMKAHTTVGVDLNNGASGMETAIDQMQIWFEIFPYATRGIPEKESDVPVASIRAEGSKYAFKWFSKQENAPGQGTTYDEFASSFEFDRIVAELLWKEWWFRVAGTEPSMYVDSASLQSIFDDVIKESQYSLVPISMLPVSQNLLEVGDAEIPMSGMLSAGGDLGFLDFSLKAGSKGTWKTNEDQAWIFGGDANLKPLEGLTLSLRGLGAVNYDETAPGTNPLSWGVGADYLVYLSDKVALKPFAGFDGKYETVSEEFTWEAGGGVFLYWRGPEFKVTDEFIHQWNKEFPVGLSLSGNLDQDGYANVVFSLYEQAGKESLVPNLGGFAEIEAINLSAANAQDSALAAAAKVEYVVAKKFVPYAFGKYVQGYKSGKLTDVDSLTTMLGLEINPVKRFTIDLRYERTDLLGNETDLDNGTLTSTFKMKL